MVRPMSSSVVSGQPAQSSKTEIWYVSAIVDIVEA